MHDQSIRRTQLHADAGRRLLGSQALGVLIAIWAVFGDLPNLEKCWAHPFHISIAEMEFNPETGRFEVALKVHASDLETALRPIAGRRLDLEKDALDDAVTVYLDRHFYLQPIGQFRRLNAVADAGKEEKDSAEAVVRSRSQFIGSELESSWLWIYFELEMPATGVGPNSPASADAANAGVANAGVANAGAASSGPANSGAVNESEAGKQPGEANDGPHENWAFVNTLFLNRITNQINTVTIRAGTKRHALKMTRSSPWQEFSHDWFQPPRIDQSNLRGDDAATSPAVGP